MESTRAYGARVVTYDRLTESREKIAAASSKRPAARWRRRSTTP